MRTILSLSLITSLTALACGGPDAPAPPPATPTPTPTPPVAATTTAKAPDAPALTTLAPPAQSVCAFDFEHSSPFDVVALRGSAGGSAFASIRGGFGGQMMVLDQKTLFVKATTKSFELWGYANGADMSLHAAKAIVLGGVFVPGREVRLHLVDAASGKLTVSAPWGRYVSKPAAPTANGEVSCSDVGVWWGDPKADGFGKAKKQMRFVGGKAAVAPTAKDKPVVEVQSENLVDVLETSGASSRVLVIVDDGWIVGWVPTTSLKPTKDTTMGGGVADRFGPGMKLKPWKDGESPTYTCAADVPVVIKSDNGLLQVGVVKAGAPIETNLGDDTALKVRLTKEKMLSDDDALVVRKADVASCPASN